jgi:hypothetical protein
MIGLGGTGGKVLAAMRRMVFQQFREVEPSDLALDYLYIDTSAQDTSIANITAPLKPGDQTWRTLGHSVQLDAGQIVHLKQGDFSHIIANPEDYPNFRSWLGDVDVWQRIWSNAPNGIEAGGQLRRFGRYLLAQNLKEVRNALLGRLSARRAVDGVADSQWTIHVVAGLAGGTGSGTLIDVLGQIKIAAGANAKIVAYVVLPETDDTPWAQENYYANGYAALAELNGFIVRRFQPTNLSDPNENYDAALPVNNVFVITNRNENGLVVDVDRVLPNIIAETMFQIVIASGDARTLNSASQHVAGAVERVWRDMVTGENYFKGYEANVPDGPEERANRFLSFGIKRVAIPHQEVREYSSMVFLRQFLLQSLNNQWVDAEGFSESRKDFNGAAIARADANRQKWLLTNAHLMLELPSLEGEGKDWRSLSEHFLAAFNGKTKSIFETTKNSNEWPRELTDFAREFYERQFRRDGVNEFYRVAERSIVDRARHIVRNRIAGDLFKSWLVGTWSLRDIARIVDELIADVSERIGAGDAKIQRHAATEQQREEERKKLTASYLSRSSFNPVTLFQSRRRLLQQISDVLAPLYAERAAGVATAYMQKTLAAVLAQLQDLKSEVELIGSRFDQALTIVDRKGAARVRNDESEGSLSSHQYKLYDPGHVRDLLKRLEQTESLQRSQVSSLRDRLAELMGSNPGFATMTEFSEARIVEALESAAELRAETALSEVEADRDRILEASVIQKLYEEFAGRDEDLRRFVTERVREAGTFAAFSPRERAAHGSDKIKRALVAFVPAADELKENLREFRSKLVGFIQNAGNGAPVPIVDTHDRRHEIVFLSLVNGFPIRYLEALDDLKKRYDRLVAGPDQLRKRLELHSEGDGSELPPLHVPGIDEVRRQTRPHWLLAELAGLLVERKNQRTGQIETILKVTNEDGEIRTPVVGGAISVGTRTVDHAGASELRKAIGGHLRTLVHVDDRKALTDALIRRKNEALERAQFVETDADYVLVSADVKQARSLIDSSIS